MVGAQIIGTFGRGSVPSRRVSPRPNVPKIIGTFGRGKHSPRRKSGNCFPKRGPNYRNMWVGWEPIYRNIWSGNGFLSENLRIVCQSGDRIIGTFWRGGSQIIGTFGRGSCFFEIKFGELFAKVGPELSEHFGGAGVKLSEHLVGGMVFDRKLVKCLPKWGPNQRNIWVG